MLGAISVKPNGFIIKNQKTSAFILNPTFEFRLKWQFDDHIFPGLGVSAILPLVQHAFYYRTDAGEKPELYRMQQLALGANLSLEAKY